MVPLLVGKEGSVKLGGGKVHASNVGGESLVLHARCLLQTIERLTLHKRQTWSDCPKLLITLGYERPQGPTSSGALECKGPYCLIQTIALGHEPPGICSCIRPRVHGVLRS